MHNTQDNDSVEILQKNHRQRVDSNSEVQPLPIQMSLETQKNLPSGYQEQQNHNGNVTPFNTFGPDSGHDIQISFSMTANDEVDLDYNNPAMEKRASQQPKANNNNDKPSLASLYGTNTRSYIRDHMHTVGFGYENKGQLQKRIDDLVQEKKAKEKEALDNNNLGRNAAVFYAENNPNRVNRAMLQQIAQTNNMSPPNREHPDDGNNEELTNNNTKQTCCQKYCMIM